MLDFYIPLHVPGIYYIYTFYTSLIFLQYIFLNPMMTVNRMFKTQYKILNAFAYTEGKMCA